MRERSRTFPDHLIANGEDLEGLRYEVTDSFGRPVEVTGVPCGTLRGGRLRRAVTVTVGWFRGELRWLREAVGEWRQQRA